MTYKNIKLNAVMEKTKTSDLVKFLIGLSRTQKKIIIILLDSILLMLSVWMAYALRMSDIFYFDNQIIIPCLLAPVVAIPLFIRMNIYRTVIRFLKDDYWKELTKVLFFSVCIWYISLVLLQIPPPRSLIFLYTLLAFTSILGSRTLARSFIIGNSDISRNRKRQNSLSVCIYGAGTAGRALASALSHGREVYVCAFIEDDTSLQGTLIQGKLVISPNNLSDFAQKEKIDEILIALPSVSNLRRREIIDAVEEQKLKVRNIPGVSELALGRIRKAWFQGDYIAQILGREKALPDQNLLTKCITGKNVLVTGAGGSIGSELCRQIVELRPERLVLFELSEIALYEIDGELSKYVKAKNINLEIIGILGSVINCKHLIHVMNKFKIETVYHAAAYKHVPIVEHNMGAGLRNNIFGTLNSVEAAVASNVKNFVLISTDKAVRPTNVMGGSKRMAELVIQAISNRERQKENSMRLSMVRFGNVLGSSGSVIPLFLKQIRIGGPVTVTHSDINRFFMTIPEAASLVIQAGAMGRNGDVFVLDMGKPIKIIDLARRMIEIAGFKVLEKDTLHTARDGDIEIIITGLRPGEKLYEELLIGDNVSQTEHNLIMRASEISLTWEQVQVFLRELEEAIEGHDCDRMRKILLDNANGYKPDNHIVDFLN